MKKLKELEIIKEIQPLAFKAQSLEINNPESLKEATSILSRLNKLNDSVDEERSKVLRPLLEATKAERARWKPAEEYYKSAIEAIRLKMTQYQTNLVQENKAKEEAIASRIGEGKGSYKFETAVRKIENLPTIEKETATEEGLVQFREKKQLKVTDITLIPDLYWRINEELILNDLKNGLPVPGVEIEIIQVPVNYR